MKITYNNDDKKAQQVITLIQSEINLYKKTQMITSISFM